MFELLLSAGRALTLGGGHGGDVLSRPGGARRASGRRLRHGMVVGEARRMRNGVYLTVARARGARRPPLPVLLGLGCLAVIAILGIWLALQARSS